MMLISILSLTSYIIIFFHLYLSFHLKDSFLFGHLTGLAHELELICFCLITYLFTVCLFLIKSLIYLEHLKESHPGVFQVLKILG